MKRIICLFAIICMLAALSSSVYSAENGTIIVDAITEREYIDDYKGFASVLVTYSAEPELYVYQNNTKFAISNVYASLTIDPETYRPLYNRDVRLELSTTMTYNYVENHYVTKTITFACEDTTRSLISASTVSTGVKTIEIYEPDDFIASTGYKTEFCYYGKSSSSGSEELPAYNYFAFTLEEVKSMAGY